MAKMCFPEEGCEFWWIIIFGRVPSRRMYIKTRYVVYNGCKLGFCIVSICTSKIDDKERAVFFIQEGGVWCGRQRIGDK